MTQDKFAKKIIAVVSGKGGVGKSTLSSLISMKLKLSSKKVGLLDADIYGPSIPYIFNINEDSNIDKVNQFIPKKILDIELQSFGFFIEQNRSSSFRGPMITKIFRQMISKTHWSDLDYLIIDMPPGTGDIHITLASELPLDYVIAVVNSHKLSHIEIQKTINFYQQFSIPVHIIIENMVCDTSTAQYIANQCQSYFTTFPLQKKISQFSNEACDLQKMVHLLDISRILS